MMWSSTLALLAELCWRLSDKDRAELLEDHCALYRGQLVVMAWGVCCLGAMDRYLAMLAVVLGDTEGADRRFAAAASLEEKAGATALLTRTRLAAAANIVRTDPRRARHLAGQVSSAVEAFSLDGLRPDIAEIEHRLG
jgi:hypothetical protein